MVVLSASVCTRKGKPLVSRQFVEMARIRVEGLLAAFPKLVRLSQQHTFVETGSVRYVYQPLENHLYLVLITTKSSNIVEDLETLRLLAKIVSNVTRGLTEATLNDHAFELIFAIDEVLTANGYKDETNLSQIHTNLLMDSHEEQIQDALTKEKIERARAEMEAKAKLFQAQKLQAIMFATPSGLDTRMQGISGNYRTSSEDISDRDAQPKDQANNVYSDNIYAHMQPAKTVPDAPMVIARSGIKLGSAKQFAFGGDALKTMGKKDNHLQGMISSSAKAFSDLGTSIVQPVPAAPTTPLMLMTEEKVSVKMNQEGSVEAAQTKGTLSLTANTDDGAGAVVFVDKPDGFVYSTHPKVDKKAYEQMGALSFQRGKDFPIGKTICILRWSSNSTDATPLTVQCWPEEEIPGIINVSIEISLTRKDLLLYDVNISIPLGCTSSGPKVMNVEDGSHQHAPLEGMLYWHFDQFDKANSIMEFQIPGHNLNAFFPINVSFRSEKLFCPMNILLVKNSVTAADIPYQQTSAFLSEHYECVA